MKFPSPLFALCVVFLLFSCKESSTQQEKNENGNIRHIEVFQSSFIGPRSVDIWTPSDFDTTKKYAVLYMHDGQMLFDTTITWNKLEWGVDETMSRLSKENKIKDAIVVGIWNHREFRSAEYFPQTIWKGLNKNEQQALETNFFRTPPKGDDYLRFIVHELKPYIDNTYPTHTEANNTFIMGSSMGGLISLYAICEYPQIFGGAGCISTHWPMAIPDQNGTASSLAAAFRNYLDQNLPDPKDHRIYFDYGTATLDSLYEPHQILVDTIMKAHGFNDQNWMTKKFPGEEHSERAWSKRLNIPLEFLLGDSNVN